MVPQIQTIENKKIINCLHLRVLFASAEKVFPEKIYLQMDLSRTTIVMSAREAYSRLPLVEIPVQQSNRPEGRPSDAVDNFPLTYTRLSTLVVCLNEVFYN